MLGPMVAYCLIVSMPLAAILLLARVHLRRRGRRENTAHILADWQEALDAIDAGTPAHAAVGRSFGPWGWRNRRGRPSG